MQKQFFVLALVVGLGGLLALSCGSSQPSMGPTGTVAIFGGDTPVCDVVSFDAMITSATLTPGGEEGDSNSNNGPPVTVISSPTKVDFAALMDFFTVLNLANVSPGTYSQITLNLSSMQITVLDGTAAKPIPTTPTSATVTVNIDPPLDLTANGSVALNLDFHLRRSLQTQQGQLTGTVNPVITARAQGPRNEDDENGDHHQELGDDEDLKGTVKSVSTTMSNGFTGSFTLDTQAGNMPVVDVTSNTKFDGVSGLSALTAGTFVEVDAFVDPNGNIVARQVEVEGQEDNDHLAFRGMITTLKKSDSSGNVQQFIMFVRQESSEAGGCVPPKSNLIVNVTSSTEYRIIASGLNRAGLTFNASALGVGQEIGVFGQCQTGQSSPTANALGIFLRRETVLCNFTKRLAVGSDGKTGGFAMIPCGAVFNGETINVLTFAQTAFANVADLNALTSGPTLAVKGLLLYEPTSLTVNNVTINRTPSTPAAVMEAKQVHQFGADD
jgi:uncharacterized protein DUF4382/uncharacterized protein DUF5666